MQCVSFVLGCVPGARNRAWAGAEALEMLGETGLDLRRDGELFSGEMGFAEEKPSKSQS